MKLRSFKKYHRSGLIECLFTAEKHTERNTDRKIVFTNFVGSLAIPVKN